MNDFLKNNAQTPLSEYGEFELIDYLTKNNVIKHKSTVLGIGDDAAIIDAQKRFQVVSTDVLVEGVHFDTSYCPLKHIGYKAIASNLSDIAAMNAMPEQVLVSVAAPRSFTVGEMAEIYDGMYACCERYGVDLVGGDTSSSLGGLFICVTVLGYAEEKKITKRSTAQDNDLICVSGDFGAARVGLLILERNKKTFSAENSMAQSDLNVHANVSDYNYMIERQLKPEPRLDIIAELGKHNIVPTSMIDVSDGLASEIMHICKKSDKGCVIYENKIPIDAQTAEIAPDFGLSPQEAALNGGEDYELLFTVKQADSDKIQKIQSVSIIGHINDKHSGCVIITKNNKSTEIIARGWDAYKE